MSLSSGPSLRSVVSISVCCEAPSTAFPATRGWPVLSLFPLLVLKLFVPSGLGWLGSVVYTRVHPFYSIVALCKDCCEDGHSCFNDDNYSFRLCDLSEHLGLRFVYLYTCPEL